MRSAVSTAITASLICSSTFAWNVGPACSLGVSLLTRIIPGSTGRLATAESYPTPVCAAHPMTAFNSQGPVCRGTLPAARGLTAERTKRSGSCSIPLRPIKSAHPQQGEPAQSRWEQAIDPRQPRRPRGWPLSGSSRQRAPSSSGAPTKSRNNSERFQRRACQHRRCRDHDRLLRARSRSSILRPNSSRASRPTAPSPASAGALLTFVDEDTHEPFADPVHPVLATGERFTTERRMALRRQDGTFVAFEGSVAAIRDERRRSAAASWCSGT